MSTQDGAESFYAVELRRRGAIVRRTARRYLDVSELAPSFVAIDAQLAELDPGATSLLVDLRAIAGRNDADFEQALAPLRRRLLRRFARAAVVVRSEIGRLQLKRHLAADGIDAQVFADEAQAMRWFESDA